ncbi:MAG: HPr family phosphocarrier protein [Vallitalea sp.]|jgi:phosphocarrier protein|nr:HPr family phosphocarrier protein [Vallitalea sp.]
MKSGKFIIGNKLGIHARPAAEIVKMSAKYECKVTFEGNSKKADGKSVLMLITMGAVKGTEIDLTIDGKDEDKLYEELSEYISNNFYEE